MGGTPLDDQSRREAMAELADSKRRFEEMDEGADRALLHDHIQDLDHQLSIGKPPCDAIF